LFFIERIRAQASSIVSMLLRFFSAAFDKLSPPALSAGLRMFNRNLGSVKLSPPNIRYSFDNNTRQPLRGCRHAIRQSIAYRIDSAPPSRHTAYREQATGLRNWRR